MINEHNNFGDQLWAKITYLEQEEALEIIFDRLHLRGWGRVHQISNKKRQWGLSTKSDATIQKNIANFEIFPVGMA